MCTYYVTHNSIPRHLSKSNENKTLMLRIGVGGEGDERILGMKDGITNWWRTLSELPELGDGQEAYAAAFMGLQRALTPTEPLELNPNWTFHGWMERGLQQDHKHNVSTASPPGGIWDCVLTLPAPMGQQLAYGGRDMLLKAFQTGSNQLIYKECGQEE